MTTGELVKVEIRAYKDKALTSEEVGKIVLPINPEQFTQAFKVEYDKKQAQGSQGNDQGYKRTPPEELKLAFTLDGTGVIPMKGKPNTFHKNVSTTASKEEKKVNVSGQVKKLLGLVYEMNPDTHKPNYLRLLWGDFSFGQYDSSFNCMLKDLQINYTLFSPDGEPLRAKISATFTHYIEPEKRKKKKNKKSPDITHVRKVKADSSLPLMTHRIYGDPSYYLQVAKANSLVNFRRLKINDDLRFPPLEKTVSMSESKTS